MAKRASYYPIRVRTIARQLGVKCDVKGGPELTRAVGKRPSEQHWLVMKDFQLGYTWGNMEWVEFYDPEHPIAHPFRTSQGIVNVYTLSKILQRRPDTIYGYIREQGDADKYIQAVLATQSAGMAQRSKWTPGNVVGRARVVDSQTTPGVGRNRRVTLECSRCYARYTMSRTHALLLTKTDSLCGCRYLPVAERAVNGYYGLLKTDRAILVRHFKLNSVQLTLALRETKDLRKGLIKCIVNKKLKHLRDQYYETLTNSPSEQ